MQRSANSRGRALQLRMQQNEATDRKLKACLEQPFRKLLSMSRARFFSMLSGTYRSIKRHQSGASGNGLGKAMGKDFRHRARVL
jgi:hypothetical protein